MYRLLPHITNTKMQKKGELCMKKTTIIRTSNAPIIFRSKFQSQFDELPKHWQNQLVDIFFKFVNNSDDIYAADVLFLLTLSPFGGLHKLGIREKIEYFNEDILENEPPIAERSIEISKAMIKPLRNELRYQRRKVHPNFLKVQCPENCQKAYKSLFKALSYDEILTYVACSHCYNKCLSSSEYDMNRIFYLLSSSSKNIFGGLRAIGFQFYQAEFFMKHAAVLHNYLKALWLSIESNSITTNKVTTGAKYENSTEVTSFNEDDIIYEPNKTLPSASSNMENAVSKEPNRSDSPLRIQLSAFKATLNDEKDIERHPTVGNILDDIEVFKKFVAIASNANFAKDFAEFSTAVKALKMRGYDYNEVIDTLPKIESWLSIKAILERGA